MPTPPAAGAVLFADATAFRPVRAGALWRYRGVDRPMPMSVPIIYSNSISHLAGTAGESIEQSDRLFNTGLDASGLTVSGGTVTLRQGFSLSASMPVEEIRVTELRSPVRQNDQYPMLNRRVTNSGIDVDGDGREDTFDIAAYRRVRGVETITLRNVAVVAALRVDLVTLARVRLPSGVGPTVQIVQSTWYAQGFGIVRQRLESPAGIGTDLHVTTEDLEFWDGIETGLGALPPKPALVQAGMGSPAGALGSLYAAVALDDRYLTATTPYAGGVTLSAFNLRGDVIASHEHLGTEADRIRTNGRFVSTGDSVLAIVPADDGGRLVRFAADGAAVSGLTGVPLPLRTSAAGATETNYVRAASSGNAKFWLLWTRSTNSPTPQSALSLVLAGFDANGVGVTPQYELDSTTLGSTTDPSSFDSIRLSSVGDNVLASWTRYTGAAVDVRYALLNNNSPLVGTLASGPFERENNLYPVAEGAGGVLLWAGRLDRSTLGPFVVRGVRLSEAGVPLRSTAGPIDDEVVSSGWPGLAHGVVPWLSGSDATGVAFFTSSEDRLWLEDVYTTGVVRLALLEAGNGPLPLDAGSARLIGLPFAKPEFGFFNQKLRTLVFPDRVLLIGYESSAQAPTGSVTSIVVWRR
jgi:hypothetical protein